MRNWIVVLVLAVSAAFQAGAARVADVPWSTGEATCTHEVRTSGVLVWTATIEGSADKVEADCAALGAEPPR